MAKIRLRQEQKPRFLLGVVFGVFSQRSIRQTVCSKPLWVILAERSQIPPTSLSHPKEQIIASRSRSHTTRRRFPTTNSSISTGGKSIPLRPTVNSPILVRVIAPQFFMATQRRRKLRRDNSDQYR